MVLGTLKACRRAKEGWKKSACAAILVALLGQIAHYTSVNLFGLHYWFFIWGLAVFVQQSSTRQTGAALVAGRAAGHSSEAAAHSRSWARAC
jgi:hypothetical protein